MKKTSLFLLPLALSTALSLSSCAGLREAIGAGKNKTPDEFAVQKRAPLDIPYNITLPIPQPGAPRPQEVTPEQSAKDVILGAPSQTTQNASNDVSGDVRAIMTRASETNTIETTDTQNRTTIEEEVIMPGQPQPMSEAEKPVTAKTVTTESSPAFLDKLGASDTSEDIRRVVEEEYQDDAERAVPIGRRFIVGKSAEEPDAVVVDPVLERERLIDATEKGNNVTSGETPTYKD